MPGLLSSSYGSGGNHYPYLRRRLGQQTLRMRGVTSSEFSSASREGPTSDMKDSLLRDGTEGKKTIMIIYGSHS